MLIHNCNSNWNLNFITYRLILNGNNNEIVEVAVLLQIAPITIMYYSNQYYKLLVQTSSVTSRRCSVNENVATFRQVPEIRGEFSPVYLKNGKSYERRYSKCKHPWPSAIRYNAQIRCRPKGQCWNGRTTNVPPKHLKWGDKASN